MCKSRYVGIKCSFNSFGLQISIESLLRVSVGNVMEYKPIPIYRIYTLVSIDNHQINQ